MNQAHYYLIGNFKISETILVSWGIMAFLAIASYFLTRNLKKVPTSKVQIFLEFAVGGLAKMVTDVMGKNTVKRMPYMIPYIGSLFLFFACSNLSPLLGLRSPTTDLDTTAAWAMITFFMIYFAGVKFKGLSYFKELAQPLAIMLPINIIGGTIIMGLFYQLLGFISSLIPGLSIPIGEILIPVPLHLYFDLFAGLLQAYIFIMLTMVFISSAGELD